MRLQDIAALAGDIARITITQTDAGPWEVGIYLGGAISQEHKVTKYHNRSEPRQWKSLDKAVRTLEAVFDRRFDVLEIPFKRKVDDENPNQSSA